MTVAFTVVTIVVALLVIRHWVLWLVRHAMDGVPDPALHIRSPRRYVDADGRSDFRGERVGWMHENRNGRNG